MSAKSRLLLKALQEDGISEVYVDKNKPAPQSQVNLSETSAAGAAQQLSRLRTIVLPCILCKELAETRKSVVFGTGNAQAKLMFVGEAPGADEDIQGLPFVGAAGQLLTKIIESIGLKREEVFIANVLKCRPPGNRQPRPQEISNCEPYLLQQIQIIKPQLICALGTFAAQTLLKVTTPISRLRGQFYDLAGSRLICTYHPAYLLRNPGDKRLVWEDMKRIKKELELLNA